MTGRIFSINVSENRNEPKKMVPCASLKRDFGIMGDAHAGPGIRQVSLMSIEDMEKAEAMLVLKEIELKPGIFAENITTEGVDLSRLKVGNLIKIGTEVVLRVEKIGKDCSSPCRIGQSLGDCLMPKKGIFASVEKEGTIKIFDKIEIEKPMIGLNHNKPIYK
jgi:cyclic pyranopterin phosphate synthase